MELKDLFNHPVLNLDKQVRYSNLKVMFPENVAEHSELVANLAIIIALELMKDHPEVKIDLKELAWRGVIHDWGESVTCDVTSDIKYSNPQLPKILEEIESAGLKKLFNSKVCDELNLIRDINKSREGSIEGDLIMLADKMQSMFKMTKEYMIQRTESWKEAVQRAIASIEGFIIDIINKYYSDTDRVGILGNIIKGMRELNRILNEKIDFI
jgi:5'-deoxynucleotidase YfbR-like HD superfamily hydrolase